MTEGNYPYVKERSGVLYVRGSRVPLEPLVQLWREGHDAEAIQDAYTALTLAEVYGAIAYYFAHRDEVDKEITASEAAYHAQRAAAEASDLARYAQLGEQFRATHARRTTLNHRHPEWIHLLVSQAICMMR